MLTIIALSVAFTTAIAITQGIYWAYVGKQEEAKKELARRLGMLDSEDSKNSASLFRAQAKDAAAMALGTLGEHLQALIAMAAAEYTVGKLLQRMAVGATVGFLIGFLKGGPAVAILPAAFGGLIPYLLLKRTATNRTQLLVSQLPEALDLISRSLQAGMGINDTFRMVAEEMPFPIAGEFGQVFEEIRFGRDFRVALQGLVDRNPTIFDMRLFVSSTLLARETGGNLIEILASISGTIRQRFLFAAKVSAMTSEARMSAIILGSLPFVVMMLISFVQPDYLLPLFQTSAGHMVLGACATSYAVGISLMRALVNVEV